MEIKVGHIADIHLGAGTAYGELDTNTGLNSFTTLQREAMEYCISVMAAKGVTYVVMAGDLFDSTDPSDSLHHIMQELLGLCERKAMSVIAMCGNHDRKSKFMNSVKALRPFDDTAFHYVDETNWVETDHGICFATVDSDFWIRPGVGINSMKVGLFHGIVPGVKLIGGFEPKPNAPMIPQADLYLLGDIHLPQTVMINGRPGIYPGSLVRLNFGEAQYDPGMNIYTIDTEKKEITGIEKISTKHISASFRELAILNREQLEMFKSRQVKELGTMIYKITAPASMKLEIENSIRNVTANEKIYRFIVANDGTQHSHEAIAIPKSNDFDVRTIIDALDISEPIKADLRAFIRPKAQVGMTGEYKLVHLMMQDFGPFRDIVLLDFPTENSSISVIGRKGDSEINSNGSGKSFIFDAIKCACYGTTYRNLPAGWAVNGETATVRAVFQGPHRICVHRTIGKGAGAGQQKVSISVDEVQVERDRIKDVQNEIEAMLGVSDATFEICTMIGAQQLSLVDKPSAWRVNYLLDLFKMEEIDAMGTYIADGLRAAQANKMINGTATVQALNQMNNARGVLNDMKVPDVLTMTSEQVMLDGLIGEHSVLNAKYQSIDADRKRNKQHNDGLYAAVESLKKEHDAAVQSLTRYKLLYDIKIDQMNKAASTMADDKKCPVCGGAIDVEHTKIHNESMLLELTNMKNEVARLVADAESRHSAYIQGSEHIGDELLPEITNDDEIALTKQMFVIETQTTSLRFNINSTQEAVKRYEQQQMAVAHAEAEVFYKNLQYIQDEAMCQYWEWLGKKLNAPVIKENIVKTVSRFLNSKATYNLSRIFGEDVGVMCDAAIKVTSAKAIPKFDIFVLRDGKNVPIEQYSKGEKAAVRIAVDLAVSELVASVCPAKFMMLIIDEAMDGLDAGKRDAIADLVKELVVTRGTVFTVSHTKAIVGKFDKVLTVENVNKVASAVLV